MDDKNKKNLLFVCTVGLQRSPTAASLFKDSDRYDAKYAGTHALSFSKVSQKHIDWSDEIFVFDEDTDKHRTYLEKNFDLQGKPIHVLDVPDVYFRGERELKEILTEKLSGYLQ